MTEQYTPTTEQVRDDYQRCGCDRCSLTDDSDWADEHAEFDRWLAEHDRALSEKRWLQGAIEHPRATVKKIIDD